MTDSATNAKVNGSRPQKSLADPARTIERLELYSEEHPDCKDYWVDTEIEAAGILLSMAASLKQMEDAVNHDDEGIKTLRKYANDYRQAVAQGKALNYFRTISDDDALTIFGMRIRARRIIVQ